MIKNTFNKMSRLEKQVNTFLVLEASDWVLKKLSKNMQDKKKRPHVIFQSDINHNNHINVFWPENHKIKVKSLCSPCTNRKSSEVSWTTEQFWSFTVKQMDLTTETSDVSTQLVCCDHSLQQRTGH